jgi:hypothetical protein
MSRQDGGFGNPDAQPVGRSDFEVCGLGSKHVDDD